MAFLMSNIHQKIKANIEKILQCTYNDLSVPEHVSEMQAFLDYIRSQNIVQKHKFFITETSVMVASIHTRTQHICSPPVTIGSFTLMMET
jgi:hypothetical protein